MPAESDPAPEAGRSSPGALALLLHAHLPFVRHPEHENFLEEDWLFEAISETYLPLLRVLRRLAEEEIPFRLTFSLTPTLCAMLQDDLLQERYQRHLERLLALVRAEVARFRDHPQLGSLTRFYLRFFEETRAFYSETLGGNLVRAFRELQDAGHLEIAASAATHAFLPLWHDFPRAQRAQIQIGCDAYRESFGVEPRGFWLPECGYADKLDLLLQERNLRWFVLDSHGLLFGQPRPQRAIFSPAYTFAGPAAFARDGESSREVWSAECGYPGDVFYRDFYRDAGFDRSEEELGDFLAPPGVRKFSGLKYHRVTGRTAEKDFYDPERAQLCAERHAADFLAKRKARFRDLASIGFAPVIVSPFDAELFGHWWFEGPQFLEDVLREAARQPENFRLCTPAEFLREHPSQQVVRPSPSSWGENGYSAVWLDPSNAWIYPPLFAATRRMLQLADEQRATHEPLVERALRQAARELLLAQASDWAFLIKTRSAPHYATARVQDHLQRFNRLAEQIESKGIASDFLGECEARANLFPNLNWRHFL